MKIQKWRVGDTVSVFNAGGGTLVGDAVITKIGRTLFYVDVYGREIPFAQDSGYERRSDRSPGLGLWADTAEGLAERARRKEAQGKLLALDVANRVGGPLNLDTAQLELIIALLTENQVTEPGAGNGDLLDKIEETYNSGELSFAQSLEQAYAYGKASALGSQL